jgi:hypothetical protein
LVDEGDEIVSSVGDELRAPDTGAKVIRGAVVRTIGYALGALSNVVASIVLLRYLGICCRDFDSGDRRRRF